MNIECSSVGTRRLSSFCAFIKKENRNVEDVYQTAKVVVSPDGNVFVPTTWREGKGRKPSCFRYNHRLFPLAEFGTFFDFLWWEYLSENQDLVLTIMQPGTTFSDKFGARTWNNTAKTMTNFNTIGWPMVDMQMRAFQTALTLGGIQL